MDEEKAEEGTNSNYATPLPALPAPATVNNASVLTSDQPRQPRNLQELLRYSTEVGGGNNSPAELQPLDEERRVFLEQAIKALTVDAIEELLKAINVLKHAGTLELEDDPTECEEALTTIADYVDNIDVANDFYKIGGFCIFQPCLNSAHSSIRWRVADVLAELTQNNPYCQDMVLNENILPLLLSLSDTDSSPQVRSKAFHAVSCLVRGNKKALCEFQKLDGFSILLRALQSDDDKLKVKAAFFLSSLKDSEVKDELQQMGFIEQFVSMIPWDPNLGTEHLLSALLALATDHAPSQETCRNPVLQLQALLSHLLEECQVKEEYQEICEYSKELLNVVFQAESGADR